MNYEIEYQKIVGKEVLTKLQILDCYAVIAGGACRDWKLSIAATDLDCYMYYNPHYPDMVVKQQLEKLLNVELDIIGNETNKNKPNYNYNPDFKFVLQGQFKSIPIQIIVLNTPKLNVGDFCFNICQAYTENGIDIITTPAFDWAVANKAIEVTGKFYSHQQKYIDKIKAKFPHYEHNF